MAVYTMVEKPELALWLDNHFSLGELLDVQPIASGTDNSNFFLTMVDNKDAQPCSWVFTIFEWLKPDQMFYYLSFMRFLAEQGLSVPSPCFTQDRQLFALWGNKPAAVVSKVPGVAVVSPSSQQCYAIGVLLAKMHLAAKGFELYQPNQRNFEWCLRAADDVSSFLDQSQSNLLSEVIKTQTQMREQPFFRLLPSSAVHCDLFRDNVLFDKENNPSVIDFYFAGNDTWLFDLCVTLNDWTSDPTTGQWKKELSNALWRGYTSVRPLTTEELGCVDDMLQMAALRFWLSRLLDFHLPRPASIPFIKDPTFFERILRLRKDEKFEFSIG
jgi:homoserine kinase type II